MRRRNSEEKIRRLERQAQAGDPGAEVKLMRELVRTGRVRPVHLQGLAALGDPVARSAVSLPEEIKSEPPVGYLNAQLLERLGPIWSVIAGVAFVEAALAGDAGLPTSEAVRQVLRRCAEWVAGEFRGCSVREHAGAPNDSCFWDGASASAMGFAGFGTPASWRYVELSEQHLMGLLNRADAALAGVGPGTFLGEEYPGTLYAVWSHAANALSLSAHRSRFGYEYRGALKSAALAYLKPWVMAGSPPTWRLPILERQNPDPELRRAARAAMTGGPVEAKRHLRRLMRADPVVAEGVKRLNHWAKTSVQVAVGLIQAVPSWTPGTTLATYEPRGHRTRLLFAETSIPAPADPPAWGPWAGSLLLQVWETGFAWERESWLGEAQIPHGADVPEPGEPFRIHRGWSPSGGVGFAVPLEIAQLWAKAYEDPYAEEKRTNMYHRRQNTPRPATRAQLQLIEQLRKETESYKDVAWALGIGYGALMAVRAGGNVSPRVRKALDMAMRKRPRARPKASSAASYWHKVAELTEASYAEPYDPARVARLEAEVARLGEERERAMGYPAAEQLGHFPGADYMGEASYLADVEGRHGAIRDPFAPSYDPTHPWNLYVEERRRAEEAEKRRRPAAKRGRKKRKKNPLLAIAGNPGRKKRKKKNPPKIKAGSKVQLKGKAAEKAAKRYKKFHGHNPTHATVVQIDDGKKGVTRKVVVALGTVPETHYQVPWKSNKEGYYWVHPHPKGDEPLEVLDPDTELTFKIPGSRTKVTDWWHH